MVVKKKVPLLYRRVDAQMPPTSVMGLVNSGNWSRRENAWPMRAQFCKFLLAVIGMPGKARKLDDAQKKVSSNCLTKMQLVRVRIEPRQNGVENRRVQR